MGHLRRRLFVIGVALALVLTGGTIGFIWIEDYPPFDAFYMTLTTVLTVGYGEIRTLSHAGRVFNSFLIMFGVTTIFLAVGAMTQTIIELELNQFFGKRRVRKMIDKLEGHIILCGFGRVGRGAAEELLKAGTSFVVIDNNDEKVERAIKAGMLAVLADAGRDEALRDVGISRAKGLIATLALDADNLFVILSAKTLNPNLRLSARIDEESSEQKMRRAGADFVFAPYNTTGHRMARAMLKPHVLQFLDFTEQQGVDVEIEQVQVTDGCSFAGRTLADVDVQYKSGVVILAIRKASGEMLFNPSPQIKMSGGDHLIAMGDASNLQKLERLLIGTVSPMKVLTSEQMREVDRLTIEDGVPSIALMENAAHRVVEEMVREFDPIDRQNIVILCGKGNNGGDGLAIARLLHEYHVGRLRVVLAADPSEFKGDAAENLKRAIEIGIQPVFEVPKELLERSAVNVVVDALLGTGLKGPPEGRTAELIRATREFPQARIVAVDMPSGLGGGGDSVRADITVTFTAPKVEHYLAPGAEEQVGRLVVSQIGSPPWLIPGGLEVSSPNDFRHLFRPRKREANKGNFGHVLVIGGAPGKAGAAAMAGLAALRAGAGLVSVSCSDPSRLALELMSEPFDGFTLDRKTVVAVGPGLGLQKELVAKLLKDVKVPTVIDADALNSIAGTDFRGRGVETVLTPHPGEMARLLGVKRVSESERLRVARTFAQERNVCLVLKGYRTLIALPDGNVSINTTGSPAMATGGTGDILTGMIAGLVAQFPDQIDTAVRAAVWLHGRAGQLGAAELTEQCLIATDLLHYLPKAIREIA